MKIYIVRHGQTIWNKEKKMQGWKDSPLTEEGIEGAKKLGLRLENVDFDGVYSSPLKRTQDTTRYVLGDKTNEVVYLDDLKEINLGLWEGEHFKKVEEDYKEEMNKLFYKPDEYETVGGENYSDVYERAENAFQTILDGNHENVLLVSHGIWINVFLSKLKNCGILDLWEDAVVVPNTSLTLIEVKDNSKIDYILEGDISHL